MTLAAGPGSSSGFTNTKDKQITPVILKLILQEIAHYQCFVDM